MISISNGDFRRAVAIAASVVEKRTTIPILSGVRCIANGHFEASGTDLDMLLKARTARGGEGEARFMLPNPRALVAAIGAVGGADIAITPDANAGVALDANGFVAKFRSDAVGFVDDWPETGFAIAEESFTATLGADHLRQLARLQSAISTEETRYYLNGVHIRHLDGWTYRAAATDGHRLLVADLAWPDAVGTLPEEGIIIPRRALERLLDLGKGDQPVALVAGPTVLLNAVDSTTPEKPAAWRFRFAGEQRKIGWELTLKLIEGKYPDYARVIPQNCGHKALMAAADLKRAVRAVSAGTESKRTPAMKFVFAADRVTVSAEWHDFGGSASIDFPCQHDLPLNFTVGYNGRYLLDMLDAIRGNELAFGITDTTGPALIRNPSDSAFFGVLMPMRV